MDADALLPAATREKNLSGAEVRPARRGGRCNELRLPRQQIWGSCPSHLCNWERLKERGQGCAGCLLVSCISLGRRQPQELEQNPSGTGTDVGWLVLLAWTGVRVFSKSVTCL